MKCSKCHLELGDAGMVLTYVSSMATYTATVHFHCLDTLVGGANARKMRNLAFESGWAQTGLPLFDQPRT